MAPTSNAMSSQDLSSQVPCSESTSPSQAIAVAPVFSSVQSPTLFSSSPSPSQSSQASTVSVAYSGNSVSSGFPLNFSIPTKWRPSIMFAIEESKLTPDVL